MGIPFSELDKTKRKQLGMVRGLWDKTLGYLFGIQKEIPNWQLVSKEKPGLEIEI